MADSETLELIITARDMASKVVDNLIGRLSETTRALGAAQKDQVREAEIGAKAQLRIVQDTQRQILAHIIQSEKRQADQSFSLQSQGNKQRAAAEVARVRDNTRTTQTILANETRLEVEKMRLAQRQGEFDARMAAQRIKDSQRAADAQTKAMQQAASAQEKAQSSSFANMSRVGMSVLQGIGMAVGFNVMNMGRQIADSLMGAVTAGVQFNDVLFTAETSYRALTKSAETAKTMVQDIFTVAAKTPFTFEGVSTGATRLLAYGWAAEKVIPTLKTIGDAASALGRGEYTIDHLIRAFGQMQNKGHVMTQEMIQFSEAGINAWQYLADTLNVDVATAMKMVEDRSVESSVAIEGIMAGMKRDFAGMSEEMNKTMAGLATTVTDNAKMILSVVFKPTYDGIRELLYEFAFETLPKWLEDVQAAKNEADKEKRNQAAGGYVPQSYPGYQVESPMPGNLDEHRKQIVNQQIEILIAERELLNRKIAEFSGLEGGEIITGPAEKRVVEINEELGTLTTELSGLGPAFAASGPAMGGFTQFVFNATGAIRTLTEVYGSFIGMADATSNKPLDLIVPIGNMIGSKAVVPEWDETNKGMVNNALYASRAALANALLGDKLSSNQTRLKELNALLAEQIASNAPADAIAEIRDQIDGLLSDSVMFQEAMLKIQGGDIVNADQLADFVWAHEKAAAAVTKSHKDAAKEAASAYKTQLKDLNSTVSGLLSPTSVTAGDMFKTQTGMSGGYQDKWDEYIRRLEAGVNGSKEWAHMVPDAVKKMTKEQKQGWLAEQKDQFYGGYLQNADWQKGGINWDAFVKSYAKSVLDENQKQALTDQAMKELEKAGFKGNADDIKIALGFSSGGEKSAKTFTAGYLGVMKAANLPVETNRILAEQTLANQKPLYDAGGAMGTVVFNGLVNGANVDVMKALVDKLTGPVSDNIDRRKNAGGQQP